MSICFWATIALLWRTIHHWISWSSLCCILANFWKIFLFPIDQADTKCLLKCDAYVDSVVNGGSILISRPLIMEISLLPLIDVDGKIESCLKYCLLTSSCLLAKTLSPTLQQQIKSLPLLFRHLLHDRRQMSTDIKVWKWFPLHQKQSFERKQERSVGK